MAVSGAADFFNLVWCELQTRAEAGEPQLVLVQPEWVEEFTGFVRDHGFAHLVTVEAADQSLVGYPVTILGPKSVAGYRQRQELEQIFENGPRL